MQRWQACAGVVIGLLAGAAVLTYTGGGGKAPSSAGPVLSECDGALRELVIHWEPSSEGITGPVYRRFLAALDGGVTVHVVCPDLAAFDRLEALLGPVGCRLQPVVVDHPITTWSRDRWVALGPPVGGGPTTVWSPRGEAAGEVWPARAGDERVGDDLGVALAPAVRALRSGLFFDGGDFLADGDNVFVVSRMVPRNVQHTVENRDELLRILAARFQRRVILLEESPDHHAGMFLAAAGARRVVVGDPGLGERLWGGGGVAEEVAALLPGGPDFTAEAKRLFEAVAERCAAEGYAVTRIPVVPSRGGRAYLTYTNVVIDEHDGRRIVYLPVYQGVDALNAAAAEIWRQLGCEVRPVDCTGVCRHGGCLHCLVNVLRRDHRPA